MNKLNATAFVIFVFLMVLAVSCKKTPEATIFSNNSIQMTPAATSSATGTLSVSYNNLTKVLNYTVTYSGLSGPFTALHIHGLAAPGFKAPHVQVFTFSGSTAPGVSGSYSNSLFVDGIVVKEEDLLAGQYYLDIHTAAFPANTTTGAIPGYALENPILRGQITFK